MFEDVLGQERAKEFLEALVLGGKTPYGVLIYGPPRSGKLTAAKTLARALNCRAERSSECGCASCVKVRSGSHPDVRVVTPNDKGHVTIDVIRSEIVKAFDFKLHEGRRKVAVISRADQMQPSAANALLKVLEEPRGGATIILTTSNYGQLLETIKSRCQSVRFSFLSASILTQLLQRDSQDPDPVMVELMGGTYSPTAIQDELPLLRHVFDGSDVEGPDKIEEDAIHNELLYLGCAFAYMQRSNMHTFSGIVIQRANSVKLGKLFSVTDQAIRFVTRGVRPYLVVRWYESRVREVIS